jgi:hypothetical protein
MGRGCSDDRLKGFAIHVQQFEAVSAVVQDRVNRIDCDQ